MRQYRAKPNVSNDRENNSSNELTRRVAAVYQ